MKHRVGKAALVAVLLIASSAVSISRAGIAHAMVSYNTGSGGNCNSWYPHGWSWTTWTGGTSSDSATVNAYLSWYDPPDNTYIVELHTSATGYGATGDVEPDLYYPYYEYGTGSWSEDGYHTATFFSGTFHSSSPIWCG